MLLGNDTSSFQGQIDFGVFKNNANFVMIKAGEGSSYIDKWFGYSRGQARTVSLPCGFYHFARPDLGNTPEQEAQFFCALMDGDPLQEGEVLALDFEVTYRDPVGWCKSWLDYVANHFNGTKPLLYLNQSLATSFDWSPVANAGYGLWIAAYTYNPEDNNFQSGAWTLAAMQQWTDKQEVPGIAGNVDGDVFFGTVEEFKAYGFHKPQSVTPVDTTTQTTSTSNTTATTVVSVTNSSTHLSQVPNSQNSTETSPEQPKPLPSEVPQESSSNTNILFSFIQWLIAFFITGHM